MNKYNKPKVEIVNINTSIIATPSTQINNVGRNETWDSGIVEEFDWEEE